MSSGIGRSALGSGNGTSLWEQRVIVPCFSFFLFRSALLDMDLPVSNGNPTTTPETPATVPARKSRVGSSSTARRRDRVSVEHETIVAGNGDRSPLSESDISPQLSDASRPCVLVRCSSLLDGSTPTIARSALGARDGRGPPGSVHVALSFHSHSLRRHLTHGYLHLCQSQCHSVANYDPESMPSGSIGTQQL
jgi:hypothetical protein